ncbi:precorrin 3B synthase CobZ [Thiorhodovibrio frisius]|uniref:Precorrin 3B synthase CobZ n=2 Tax=Thiorhodovibrio frisius TaxID=631362 RepID=H8Z041_9GAMM|nr:precorrin 3B synthase CobZ [Thiorhodovibrio frisius]WPL23790.1 Fumarate reductase flavoprotein subunit precursor [Thiorhodovibrio frisius]
MKSPQVLVIGGGIAGLCAAISARRAGARVLLIESAPRWRRGGNSRHGRNFRFFHDQPSALVAGSYPADEFAADLTRATDGNGDAALACVLINRSRAAPRWLLEAGVALQARARGQLPFSRKTAFLLGGGQAMVNALYARAERLGVDIRYECAASKPRLQGNRLTGIDLRSPCQPGVPGEMAGETPGETLAPGAVVLACGGAQGNADWLRQHCGERAEGFINRGTPEARGELLIDLLAKGAQAVGDPRRLYLVAVDARSPVDDGGIVTRIRGMPLGLVVDGDGRRRHDEGADQGSTRYALWGQRLADYPGQIGYLLLDAEGLKAAPAALYPPLSAPDLPRLARLLGMDADALETTWLTYNAAMRAFPASHSPPLDPPRTQPARPLATSPFAAYPMRPGLTFTYHGLAVDTQARVRLASGEPIINLFAAGTLMAPNLCPQGYLSGLMLTIGLVFGCLAGEEAARHVRN